MNGGQLMLLCDWILGNRGGATFALSIIGRGAVTELSGTRDTGGACCGGGCACTDIGLTWLHDELKGNEYTQPVVCQKAEVPAMPSLSMAHTLANGVCCQCAFCCLEGDASSAVAAF